MITGETSASGTSLDGFLLKVDSLGNLEWVQTYGLPNRTEYLTTVDLAPGNGYYLGGQLDAGGGNYDQWLIRVDSAGTVDWDEQYGTQLNDAPNAHVTSLDDGSVVFATGWATVSQYVLNLVLVKVDASGMLVWDQAYGADGTNTTLYAVKEVSPGGDLIAVGESSHPDAFNGVLLRTTAQGDSLWLRYYHYADSVWTLGKGTLRDVMPTPDGGFIAVGTAYPSSNNPNDPPIYGQDTWVVKVDSMGCLEPGCHVITGLQSQVTNWRGGLRLWPNPVPAQGQLHVAIDLPAGFALRGPLRLALTDAAGRLVQEHALPGGVSSFSFPVSSLPAGLYHVHLLDATRWLSGGKVVVSPP